MATYEIPLTPEAQTFQILLGTVEYSIYMYWNQFSNSWTIDILDVNSVPIVTGIPVVGNTNLLSPYGYLNFGGQLIAQTDNDPDTPPTYVDLGSTGHIYFVTTP